MTDPYPVNEEARAAEARARFNHSVATLKSRLAPKTLAQNAVNSAIAKGQNLSQTGVEIACKYPFAAAGLLTAIGLLLARRPLARLFARNQDIKPQTPRRKPA